MAEKKTSTAKKRTGEPKPEPQHPQERGRKGGEHKSSAQTSRAGGGETSRSKSAAERREPAAQSERTSTQGAQAGGSGRKGRPAHAGSPGQDGSMGTLLESLQAMTATIQSAIQQLQGIVEAIGPGAPGTAEQFQGVKGGERRGGPGADNGQARGRGDWLQVVQGGQAEASPPEALLPEITDRLRAIIQQLETGQQGGAPGTGQPPS